MSLSVLSCAGLTTSYNMLTKMMTKIRQSICPCSANHLCSSMWLVSSFPAVVMKRKIGCAAKGGAFREGAGGCILSHPKRTHALVFWIFA